MLSSAAMSLPGREALLPTRPSGERSFKDSVEAEEEAALARMVSPALQSLIAEPLKQSTLMLSCHSLSPHIDAL